MNAMIANFLTIIKNAAKQGSAEKRPDAVLKIYFKINFAIRKAVTEMLLLFLLFIGYSKIG